MSEMPPELPPDPFIDPSIIPMAHVAHGFFSAFAASGFTEVQALRLVAEIIIGMMKNAQSKAD